MSNYQSQFQQDRILNDHFFHNRRGGVFVDIGAHDGKTLSNTYFFEKELGWTGLCVEPLPSVFEQLKANRDCLVVNGCAWNQDTVKTFRSIEGYSEMLSGLVDTYPNQHINRIDQEVEAHGGKVVDLEVTCYNINSLLLKHKLTEIDLISIDVEGSELEILAAIDYDQIKVNIVLAENNYEDDNLRSFMQSMGFDPVGRIEIDDVFARIGWDHTTK